ncbi:MAG: hypothetical protein H8D34_25550 [Chloroflexi bacterium]|nr:hypothetical protein [Chloroflexota bacterium]
MNRKIATLVVTLLVFAMVGVIAWNEYSMGNLGAREQGSSSYENTPHLFTGTPESMTNTPRPFTPSPTPPGSHAPTLPSTPTYVLSGSLTPTPSSMPTPTQTSSPTTEMPTLLQVAAQFGVNLRDTPAGEVIQGLPEGALVQAYPEKEIRAGGFTWRHVVTLDGVEGWLAVDHLVPFSGTRTATP